MTVATFSAAEHLGLCLTKNVGLWDALSHRPIIERVSTWVRPRLCENAIAEGFRGPRKLRLFVGSVRMEGRDRPTTERMRVQMKSEAFRPLIIAPWAN